MIDFDRKPRGELHPRRQWWGIAMVDATGETFMRLSHRSAIITNLRDRHMSGIWSWLRYWLTGRF